MGEEMTVFALGMRIPVIYARTAPMAAFQRRIVYQMGEMNPTDRLYEVHPRWAR